MLAEALAAHPSVYRIAAPFEGGGLVNCYLIDAPRRALIDTGTASVPGQTLLPALRELGWDPTDLRVIINTHMHIDHAGGNADMQEASGAGIHMHRADYELADREAHLEKYCRADLRLLGQDAEIPQREAFILQLLGREWGIERALDDLDEIDLGNDIRLTAIHTPGHTPGSVCFHAPADRKLVAGDTLFFRSVGRTDLPGGDPRALITSIRTHLWPLPDETEVYPGHGPATRIGEERQHNPFAGDSAGWNGA